MHCALHLSGRHEQPVDYSCAALPLCFLTIFWCIVIRYRLISSILKLFFKPFYRDSSILSAPNAYSHKLSWNIWGTSCPTKELNLSHPRFVPWYNGPLRLQPRKLGHFSVSPDSTASLLGIMHPLRPLSRHYYVRMHSYGP